MRLYIPQWIAVCLLTCLFAISPIARADRSAFAKLDFGGTIFIEVPRNWKFHDENFMRHLNTAGEAATRLAGITPSPGENTILVAANANTSFRSASATLRLSVRSGKAPSQADMRELTKTPKSELLLLLDPVISETKKVMVGTGLIKSVKTVDARIARNSSLSCMFLEFEVETVGGTELNQTYICPAGDKLIKLSTSYRKAEAALFLPVVRHVWESLKAK